MRSATRSLAGCLSLAVVGVADAGEGALTSILRDAALRHGLRPTQQLFNDTDSHLAEVGRAYFHSENVSLNGRISCGTCHLDGFSSTDGLPNAVGIHGEGEGPARALSDGKIVPRNTLPLWGRGAEGIRCLLLGRKDRLLWGATDQSVRQRFALRRRTTHGCPSAPGRDSGDAR